MPFFCYNKNDYCDHNENCDDCDELVFGRGGKQVPSNADRIRSMTDEELAYWIMCPYDSPFCDGTDHNCIDCTKEWLQQPAEE